MTNRLMKDGLDNKALKRIGQSIAKVDNQFDADGFIRSARRGLNGLELKERVSHIIGVLNCFLEPSFEQHVENMSRLPDVWDYGEEDDSLSGFAAWPVIDYIAEYGMDFPEAALNALENLTSLFSAEFAIRPFIVQHFDITYPRLFSWCDHPSEHVRRLASEGIRPRLPWGMQLKAFIHDPEPIFPILETLRFDESDYVVRSVANNLNDISKDHPDLVISKMKSWKKTDNGKTDWIIKHATRSLVKQGHPENFSLLGFTKSENIKVTKFTVDKAIQIGQKLNFSFELKNTVATESYIVVDYKIVFVKANKKLSSKVFKLKNIKFGKNEKIHLEKSHDFKLITTRRYYAGVHKLEIIINGIVRKSKNFTLME